MDDRNDMNSMNDTDNANDVNKMGNADDTNDIDNMKVGGADDTNNMNETNNTDGADDTNDMNETNNTDGAYETGGGSEIDGADENSMILPRSDVAFKSIFTERGNLDVVEDFLRSVLDIPDSETLKDIVVSDPELLPEAEGEKLSILDIALTIPGKGIYIVEMQVCKIPDMKERLIHYWAKTAARQLSAGDNYAKFSKVIGVVIANFNFIDDDPDNYYHHYTLYDKERNSQFTDLIQFAIIEVNKAPVASDRTARWSWTKFFGSDNDAELRAAAQEREMIGKAMLTIERLSSDEKTRRRAEYEEMMRRDYVSRIEGAKREGEKLGIVKGRTEGEKLGIVKGRTEGREEGRTEGEKLGIAKERAEIAQRMATLGKTEAEIAEILGYVGDR
jgi:predicted transposase/invertase (TIGR01784 family)